jgi:hydroxymethylpyrimidine/phosphomethylpyrimidine kinase
MAATVITCVVAERPGKVAAVWPLPRSMVTEQMRCIREDIRPAAAKVGMLYQREIVEAVLLGLQEFPSPPLLVVDPVFLSSSGEALVRKEALATLEKELFPLASLLTPNLREASYFLGRELNGLEEAREASQELAGKFGVPVLLKGGHFRGPWAVDFFCDGPRVEEFPAQRIGPWDPHGTGCAFSSAITAGLALGLPLREAIVLAKRFIIHAIAKSFPSQNGRYLNFFLP